MSTDAPIIPDCERRAFTAAYSIWAKYREAKTYEDFESVVADIRSAIEKTNSPLQRGLLSAVWNAIPGGGEVDKE